MRYSCFIVIVLFFIGCSVQPPPNNWEYKSSQYFQSYKQYRLEDKPHFATIALHRAIAQAKQSANITPLATIYLGKCALDIALEDHDSKCKQFMDLQDFVSDNDRLWNYYLFIQKQFQHVEITKLEKRYQPFAKAISKKDFNEAIKIALKEDDPSTKLMMVTLLQERATLPLLEKTIEVLSFYGYKKGIIVLLHKAIQSNDITMQQKEKYEQILKILENDSL